MAILQCDSLMANSS